MPTLNAFDYSWGRPDPKQMADAGIKVVARYLFTEGKGIDDAERKALHAAGLGIVLNYEGDRGNHLKGAMQGATDGQVARQLAQNLGAPAGTPIYYSCDLQVFQSQMPAVLAYLHAADSGLYPSRAYGQYSVVERFGRPGWQTVAWSSGLVSKNAVLYQYEINQDFHGSAVDYDEILNLDELGAWWPEGAEPNMAISDDDVSKIARAVKQEPIDKAGDTLAQVLRQIRAAQDPAKLAGAIAKHLGGSADAAQIEAALRKVFADAGDAK